MSFKDFKKELARKKEQEETLRELQMAIDAHTKKRDAYMQQAKEALRAGNSSQYKTETCALYSPNQIP